MGHSEETWIGHMLRQTTMKGAVEGRNARGRPRNEYIDQMMEEMGCPYLALKRYADDQER